MERSTLIPSDYWYLLDIAKDRHGSWHARIVYIPNGGYWRMEETIYFKDRGTAMRVSLFGSHVKPNGWLAVSTSASRLFATDDV